MRVNFTPSVSSAAGEKVLAKEKDFTEDVSFGTYLKRSITLFIEKGGMGDGF